MLFRLLLAARLLGNTFFHHVIIILINPDRVSLAYAEECHNDISHNKNISQISYTNDERARIVSVRCNLYRIYPQGIPA